MDNFAEQLVTRIETAADKARRVTTMITGTLFIIGLLFLALLQLQTPIIALMFLVLAAAGGVGIYFTVSNSRVEYEYTFTNGELDIDKIINQKKRRELLSVEVRTFTAFGRYNDDMEETEDMTVVFATDNIAEHEYYADFEHKDYGKTRLVFVPDEKILSNIMKFLPVKLRKQS